MTSHVVKQIQCPKCHSLGKDNSLDNLTIYSDGHSYCYSCGYYISPNGNERIKQFTQPKQEMHKHCVLLPEDSTNQYPQRVIDWINQYELTANTLNLHNCVWSNSMLRLLFPIFNLDGSLIAYQGRDFSLETTKKRPKWYGQGNLEDTFNILGKGNILVLTEDVVSAIKVSMCGVMAMPLYGCVVGLKRFKRLKTLLKDTDEVYVWLDPDKQTEAIKEAKRGKLCGLHIHAVLSNMDPKEHPFWELKEIIDPPIIPA